MGSASRLPFHFWLLALLLFPAVQAQDQSAEPSAVPPTAAVQAVLVEAARASQAGDAATALEVAERALSLAQQTNDRPGEAQSQRTRASALVALDRRSEALAAWRDAEAASMRLGDGPGRSEALLGQALLAMPGSPQEGAALLRRALDLAGQETSRPRTMSATLSKAAGGFIDRSFADAGRQIFETALKLSEPFAGSLEYADAVNGLGRVAYRRGDLPAARDHYQRALRIRESLNPNSLESASSLNNLSLVTRLQGDLDLARTYGQRSLAISERQAPDSLAMAVSLESLGLVSFAQGDLKAARDYQQRSLEIREKLAPNSLLLSGTLGNLSNVANEQGELTLARAYGERALAISSKIAPDSFQMAATLGDLGNVVSYQGDLAVAIDYRQRALAIFEKLSPNSIDVAVDYNNLGIELRTLGDLAGALAYHQRALEIRERLAPNSLAVSSSFRNLALVALDQGDLSAARDYATRALALREKLAPDSLGLADVLGALGEITQAQGDLPAARGYQERGLAIEQKVAPNSVYVYDTLARLGALAYEQGDRQAAREYDERALAMSERMSPNSLTVAESLHELSRLASDDGHLDLAARQSARAWEIVKANAAAVAGDEARQAYQSRYRAIDSQLVRLQVASGRSDEAFVSLEEGRAQALLQLLAERGTARRLAPPDLWQRYEKAQAADNEAGRLLEQAGAAEAKARLAVEAEVAQQSAEAVIGDKRRVLADRERATAQARQAYTRTRVEAERQWGDVRQTIKAVIPTLASTAEARRVLPPDTVLIAFAVGDQDTTLFVVGRDGPVRAFTRALPSKELAARVDFVRRSVSREAGARGVKLVESDEVRVQAARDLYEKLFPATVRETILRSSRIVLSPDGALWDLPFAALVINGEGTPQYLGLEKPLVYTQSLATLGQTINATASRRAAEKLNVLVVGNPLFDNALRDRMTQSQSGSASSLATLAGAGPRVRGEAALLSRDGEVPEPLPFAEQEAKEVAALYGVRASSGPEPTEAWFRQRAPDADILHLATHGYFNPFRAVSSGLRLAVPEHAPGRADTDNDGALQAWEVFTQLQLHADLVVLSACQTGVGARVPGEGLVGLTRAFQAAGAASIVATQWRVSDRSTATGMVTFHERLRSGLSKDAALQQAMRGLATDPTTAHPYYWAPFVLVGDFHALRVPAR